jgi:hypothetical protein
VVEEVGFTSASCVPLIVGCAVGRGGASSALHERLCRCEGL